MDTKPHPEHKGHNPKWAIFYPLMMLLRRLGLILTIFLTPDFVWLQLAVQFASTTTSVIYLLLLWPLKSNGETVLEVFNEVILFLLIYHLICFTDFVPKPETRYTMGYSYIFFAASSLFVHSFLLFRRNVINIWKRFEPRYKVMKMKNLLEKKRK